MLRDRIKIGAAGKIATAFDMARAMAIGADWCNSARGFMFALGCIQSQSCHTDPCPTGVTTQDPHAAEALVVPNKTDRVYHFHQNTLHGAEGAGAGRRARRTRPSITADHIVRRTSEHGVKLLANLLPFVKTG